MLNDIGNSQRALSRFDRAEEVFREATRIRQDLGDRAALSVPLNNLGFVHILRGQYQEGIDILRQALEIPGIESSGIAGIIFSNLAEAYRALGDYENAEKSLTQGLLIHGEVEDRASQATSLAGMMYLWRDQAPSSMVNRQSTERE